MPADVKLVTYGCDWGWDVSKKPFHRIFHDFHLQLLYHVFGQKFLRVELLHVW